MSEQSTPPNNEDGKKPETDLSLWDNIAPIDSEVSNNDTEQGHDTTVEAKQSLLPVIVNKIRVFARELNTGLTIDSIEHKANQSISRDVLIIEQLERSLRAKEKKLARKGGRIIEHAENAQHESVRNSRMDKLASLDSLHAEIAHSRAYLASRRVQHERLAATRDAEIQSENAKLESYRTRLLGSPEVRAKSKRAEDMPKGYSRAERKLAMGSPNESRILGNIALGAGEREPLDNRQYNRLKKRFEELTHQRESLISQIEHNENTENLKDELESVDIRLGIVQDHLSNLLEKLKQKQLSTAESRESVYRMVKEINEMNPANETKKDKKKK